MLDKVIKTSFVFKLFKLKYKYSEFMTNIKFEFDNVVFDTLSTRFSVWEVRIKYNFGFFL